MKATIKKITKENSRVLTFLVEPEKPVSFQTGQAMSWTIPGVKIKRLYSIASAGGKDVTELWFTIAMKSDGRFTSNLPKLKVGDQIELAGPFGKFIYDGKDKKDVALIAGGTGISVLRAILHHILDKKVPIKVHLLFSIMTLEDTIYKEELEKLAEENDNFTYSMVVTNEHSKWKGRCGYVNKQMLDEDLGDYQQEFFICGPQPFIECVQDILKTKNVPPERVHIDHWGGYKIAK